MGALEFIGTYLLITAVFGGVTTHLTARSDSLTGHCQRSGYNREAYASKCRRDHGLDCWRTDGLVTPGLTLGVTAICLLWPLIVFPAIAYFVATIKPTPQEKERRYDAMKQRTAELEAELEMAKNGR